MQLSIRRSILAIADMLALIWRLLPTRFRHSLITGLYVVESRGDAAQGLRRLFALQDRLDWVTNERAMAYGNGVHPKHRLMRYHDFFVDRISNGMRVLDIGCGYGAVARSIATRVTGSTVVGVETNRERLAQARVGDVPRNLSFVEADARRNLPAGPWNVVVLSNILEHIEDRVEFLKSVLRQAQPERVLIRVPLFERDWKMPLRRELGVNYFSDSEHFIEHRLNELHDELRAAGLQPIETVTLWGEIWTCCSLRVG
jgi:ubiquinone/menaquinone biosynthesis C-methylase UbiE